MLQSFVAEFLTLLEQRETKLIEWGFYNVSWTIRDVEQELFGQLPVALEKSWSELTNQGYTVAKVVNLMRREKLVYLVPGATDLFRTRFAEGIRLMSNLRQMFDVDDWSAGPRLVSDIRVHLTPRLYPQRNVLADNIWGKWSKLCKPQYAVLQERVFRALSRNADGKAFKFAGFQERAFLHIFQKYGSEKITGSVVCAGTGSGKTKAFYIPGLVAMAPELSQEPFTKIIAVYPRNVLLADQLREAISEANKLGQTFREASLRPIRFGALLQDTPRASYFDATPRQPYHWARTTGGAIIPYLKSPVDGVSDLVWRDDDRKNGLTRLFRNGESAPDVESGVLGITREDLMAHPPDVLFLSLEMLNREMGNPDWRKAFGLLGRNSPRLLLLDEVHSYQGVPGAQVAWVLRRWLHWARLNSLHVVGLSATLRDAPVHLGRLIAVHPNRVEEFRPAAGLPPKGEMETQGGEYGIALKGDPASGKALLATSIQAGMLLSRLLTPLNAPVAPPGNALIRPDVLFRKKVFGFTDNLDSVNRWFSDMYDAEVNRRLASLRQTPNPPIPSAELARRHSEGQIWELPQQIGHNLSNALRVARTTSKDRGADATADVIIATSALEVGYDDPDVGAILHHKHPRSISSFIQRKGRAGRTMGSRPWTVVVLSDYGTDRWYFQNIEKLFTPEIDPIFLPTANPYVLRVQVAYFLLDWIGQKVHASGSPYNYLVGPPTHQNTARAQEASALLLRDLLEGGATWGQFYRELHSLFRRYGNTLNEEEIRGVIDDLVWQEPRPLLMQVIPSLLRKLESGWQMAFPVDGVKLEDQDAKRPIPSYIPKATFSDIEFGESYLRLPPGNGGRPREVELVSVSLLLSEACPGRVSKRYADNQGERGFWHAYSTRLVQGVNRVDVQALFPGAPPLDIVNGIQVFYPERAEVTHRPLQCADSSNANWIWKVSSRCEGDGLILAALNDPHFKTIFLSAKAFLHSNAEWLDILRFAPESRFDIGRSRVRVPGTVELFCKKEDGQGPAAVGFRCRVDGMRFRISPQHLAQRPTLGAEELQRFRVDYFTYRVRESAALSPFANEFQRDWLAQTSLAMLTATALTQRISIAGAQVKLQGGRRGAAKKVLSSIFRFSGVRSDGAEVETQLQNTIGDLWDNPAVSSEMTALEPALWNTPASDFDGWLTTRHVATLAQALRAAMVAANSQVDLDDLCIDIVAGTDNSPEILISELAPGGLGQIEGIAGKIQHDPLGFCETFLHNVLECSREKRSRDLLAAIKCLKREAKSGSPLNLAASGIRNASGFDQVETAKAELSREFQERGFLVTREFFTVLMSRVLRPGTSSANERIMDALATWWRTKSSSIGISIPSRIFAYCCTRHTRTSNGLKSYFNSIGGEQPSESQLFGKLQQLLVEGCSDCCPECLNHPGRYYDLGLPSRTLSQKWINYSVPTVRFRPSDKAWITETKEFLAQHGRVCVTCDSTELDATTRGLVALVVDEVELAATKESVRIVGVERTAGEVRTTLRISNPTHV